MELSAHFSHDSHPAVLILRTAAIAFSVIGVIAFSWMLNEHQYVYTDGMGEFYTMFPLIFVRCFTAIQFLEKPNHTRQNHQSEPPPLTPQTKKHTARLLPPLVPNHPPRPAPLPPRPHPPSHLHDIRPNRHGNHPRLHGRKAGLRDRFPARILLPLPARAVRREDFEEGGVFRLRDWDFGFVSCLSLSLCGWRGWYGRLTRAGLYIWCCLFGRVGCAPDGCVGRERFRYGVVELLCFFRAWLWDI